MEKVFLRGPVVLAFITILFSACTGGRPAVYQQLSGNAALQSGPMLGYVDMREALIWVQTNTGAVVEVEYWETDKPEIRYTTQPEQTLSKQGHTAKCIADKVLPGRSYQYRVRINGAWVELPYPATFKTQPLWQWRTDPPVFTVAAGSCAYVNEPDFDRPGKPYGSDYAIFTSIAAQKPEMMLWLGDNMYYREPDWATRTGMVHRFTHSRSLPELQPLLASTSHYAIWDDHDFGPNDSDGTWIHKEAAWEVFRDFWGNPTFGLEGRKGCTSWFKYADVEFFLLDNRYFRTPNHCESCPRTMLGKEQLDWLLAALAESRAPFKVVAIGGQVLTTNRNQETYTNLFPAERDTILAHIERENIQNVVFLDGDRHFSEFSALKNNKGNWVYDLTTSSLTAGVTANPEKEANEHRVAGTLVNVHNFALLRFSGPRTARQLEISLRDVNGQEIWKRTIKSNNGGFE